MCCRLEIIFEGCTQRNINHTRTVAVVYACKIFSEKSSSNAHAFGEGVAMP